MIEKISSTGGATKSEWTVYGEFSSFNDYTPLIKALKEASDQDQFIIHINSPGGDVSVGMMVVHAIQQSLATVVCNVVYPSHSMGAILAISGDFLVLQKHCFLMFHTYTTGAYGKSDEIIQDVNCTYRAIRGMIDSVLYPFLSKKELQKMHDGKDIYIHWDDADLQARLKRHFNITITDDV